MNSFSTSGYLFGTWEYVWPKCVIVRIYALFVSCFYLSIYLFLFIYLSIFVYLRVYLRVCMIVRIYALSVSFYCLPHVIYLCVFIWIGLWVSVWFVSVCELTMDTIDVSNEHELACSGHNTKNSTPCVQWTQGNVLNWHISVLFLV